MSIQEGYSIDTKSHYVLLRRRILFKLTVHHENVRGTDFHERLIRSKIDNPSETANIVVSECLPTMERLEPNPSMEGIAIEDYLHCPTYHLEIVKKVKGDGVEVKVDDNVTEEVAYFLRPGPMPSSLPDSLLRIPAKDITLAPRGKEFGGLTGPVNTPSGETFFFKPRDSGREGEFDRELNIICRIKELDLRVRVSELRGIVTTGANGDQIVGMLLTIIKSHPQGFHPLEEAFCGNSSLHQKWEEQVSSTLKILHENGMIWGDANPCNIAIDEEGDAWIIDFGGNNNAEFVDDDKKETREGDWQGLEIIFGEEWAKARRIWPSGEVIEEDGAGQS